MDTSTVSVVIPAYNAGRFIRDALESVFRQTYPVSEIIVVDDGSTDDTIGKIKSFSGKVVCISQSNAGPGAARNRGVSTATGEWIAFLDSDDCWEPEHLETLMKAAKRVSDAAMVYCGKKWVDSLGQPMDDIPLQKTFPSGWIFNDLFFANYVSSSSVVMLRKETFLDVGGFDERFKYIAEDYDLWIRIAAVAPVIGVPVYTVRYRRHDNNLTHQTVKQKLSDCEVLKKAMSLIESNAVDPRNNPQLLDIRGRMRSFYNEAAVGLFNSSSYDKVLLMGLGALRQGIMTKEILVRCLLCLLPSNVTTALRNLRRVLIKGS